MLPRILEPEVMDSAEDAHEYDAMDHSAVNEIFVTDLLAALTDWSLQRPVKTAPPPTHPRPRRRHRPNPRSNSPAASVTSTSPPSMPPKSMLALAGKNIAAAGLRRSHHTHPSQMPSNCRFDAMRHFDVVISNSIFHHIPDPQQSSPKPMRVTAPGGLLFHRDLARPDDEAALQQLVATYAARCDPISARLFAESLHAALTVEEMARSRRDIRLRP